VDLTADLDAPCSPERLFASVEDLSDYPDWLEIVERAESAPAHDGDDGDAAWLVDLRVRGARLEDEVATLRREMDARRGEVA